MKLRLLGIAAGGGFPQWNCACQQCEQCRQADGSSASTHACIAVRGLDNGWTLLNATPDVHAQIEGERELWPGPSVRSSPVSGVILTDAEFDHTIGLLHLREGASLDVWATPAVIELLSTEFPIRDLVSCYADFRWNPMEPGQAMTVGKGFTVTAFTVSDRAPRYSARRRLPDAVVALRLTDQISGKTSVWAPQVPSWSAISSCIDGADVVFVDGTFWSDEELIHAGAGDLPAEAMGHLAVGGDAGIAQELSRANVGRRLLVHINNTNPILDPCSMERRTLSELGIEVAPAGLNLEL